MVKTILISDAEPAVRMNLRAMLKNIGCDDVMECADGKRAVEMALSGFPELAILDETMPEMDGITAARSIRKKLKIPIVLLNACDSATAKRAAKSGIVAFLTKPLRHQDLLPTLLEIALAHSDEVEELKKRIEELKETIENRKIIEKAKRSLMERDHLSEVEAYHVMQKLAMDRRMTLLEVANSMLI